ncbi:PKD domain-containing protein [Candidatus Bipolaricaulota bacterium]|nr:PKD domain-containing protein [Candidatus Bipolaricaulota bacterium]
MIIFLAFILFSPLAQVNAQDHIVVNGALKDDPVTSKIDFFRGNISAEDFYNYYRNAPNTGLEKEKGCILIPYKSPGGKLNLIILLGDPESPYGGRAQLTLEGLKPNSAVSLFDDKAGEDRSDNYSLGETTGNFRWSWSPMGADGAIITNLPSNMDLSLSFGMTENLKSLHIVTGNLNSTKRLRLDPEREIRLRTQPTIKELEPCCSVPDFARVGEKVTFSARGSAAPRGEIAQYEWDFDNDGFFSYVSQTPRAVHTFEKSGNHSITLKVTGPEGNQATLERTIKVVNKPLVATRKLSTETITPGSTFEVSVKITARVKVSGLGIEENLPEDWQVIDTSKDDFTFKRSEVQWILQSSLRPDETKKLNYKVRAPSAAQLEDKAVNKQLDISGEVSSVSPKLSSKTGGDSGVNLVTSLNPLVALAHFDFEKDKLDFSLPGKISDTQIEQVIRIWKNGGEVPGLNGKKLNFHLVKKALLYHQKGAEVGTELSQPANPDFRSYRRISTKLPDDLLYVKPDNPLAAGGEVEFSIAVIIQPRNRTLMGAGIDDEIPSNWEIIPKRTEKLAYKSSTRQWILTEPILPGEKFTIRYSVKLPCEETPGTYELFGEVSESWSKTSITVKGDNELELVKELPIKLVLSRWNLETGELDLDLDNHISLEQAKLAIHLWVKDLAVPYTGGAKLRFATIKEIMVYQLEGKSVRRTL